MSEDMAYIEYDPNEAHDSIDAEDMWLSFCDALRNEIRRRWDWYPGFDYVLVDDDGTYHQFNSRGRLNPETNHRPEDVQAFLWNSIFRFRNEVKARIYLDDEYGGLRVMYNVYNGSNWTNATIYPAVWYVRDMKTNKFITWKRIGDRGNQSGDMRGDAKLTDPAWWDDAALAEDDIEELFAKGRGYQIELMDSGFVLDGIKYL